MRLHGCSRYRLSALAALLLLAGGTAARAQSAVAATASTKYAVINVRQAIVTTAEGKLASAQLQSQFAPRQGELEGLQKQMTDLQNRLSAGARTLSADEQARLQRQGDLLSHEFQRKQDDLNEEVTAAQGDIVDTIGRKMLDVLDRYARENGLALVLDSSAQGSPVVYSGKELDVTDAIVRLYDQSYPVKESATETKKPAGTAAAAPGQTAVPKKTIP
jgi:outer membrane protein